MSLLCDAEAAERLVAGGATVLDARSTARYFMGHVPGAVHLSWRAAVEGGPRSGTLAAPETVAAVYAAAGVSAERQVLIVGDWSAGWGEEGRLAWDLTWTGHRFVQILRGGMAAWPGRRAHLSAAPKQGNFLPTVNAGVRGPALGADLTLDVREPDEFGGEVTHGAAWGGHLPGAVNMPWRAFLGRLPSLPTGSSVGVYCTGGVRSALVWALLTDAGYTVRNDDSGWWGWAAAHERPKT